MKKNLSLLLVGSQGRVNQELLKLVEAQGSGFSLAGHLKRDGEVAGSLAAHVVVDFSQPEGMKRALEFCMNHSLPLVSGTTGFGKDIEVLIEKASHKIPVFISPNMSLGLNLMVEALNSFAQKFHGSEVAMTEIHHRHKKDKPSGTAKFILENLKQNLPQSVTLDEPHCLRGGGVFGVHKVFFLEDSEVVSFEHEALNRAVFAKGALAAARWLVEQKPGRYGMKQLMGKLK